MRLLLLILLSHCAVFQKENPLPFIANKGSIALTPKPSVYIVYNDEIYKNDKKENSGEIYNTIQGQIQNSNLFSSIETEIEKADLILEIEFQTRKKYNPYLPFATALTLTFIPFLQKIDLIEHFRLLKKNGEIVFTAKRNLKVNFWFGFAFIVHGIVQFSNIENHNRIGFENDLIESMNQSILTEISGNSTNE